MDSFRRPLVAVLGAIAVAGAALLGPTAAAVAVEELAPGGAGAGVEWVDEELRVGYGEALESALRLPGVAEVCATPGDCRLEVSARGGSFPPAQPDTIVRDGSPGAPADQGYAFWSIEGGTPTLPTGTHRLDASLVLPDGAVLRTGDPLVIVVDPAELTTTVQVSADPGERTGAVVSAQLDGDYLQRVNSYHVGLPLRTPAGRWTVTAVDEAGATVLREERVVEEGGPVAVSWYWASIPAETRFTVRVSFAPSGSYADDLEVVQAAAAGYTSPAAPEVPIVEVDPPSAAEPTVADSVPIPTGAVAGAGLVAIVLLAIAIVLAVRLERHVARADAGAPREEASGA